MIPDSASYSLIILNHDLIEDSFTPLDTLVFESRPITVKSNDDYVFVGLHDNEGCYIKLLDTDYTNDCLQDCNEDWGGEAFINECMVCVGGNTNNDITTGLDCNDICWGTGKLDECGVCDGKGSIYECGCKEKLEDTCDCDGNVIDDCGECGGNGLEY